MTVKDVKVQTIGDTLKVSAQCKIRKIGWDEVYFTFTKEYKDYIFVDASAFAAALLLPSMKQGEDLIIKGAISRRLYQGMQKSMKYTLQWGLGLKPIKITVDTLTVDTQTPKAIGVFFSGGVDSFYTYLKNKNNKDGKISHFILVNGYDIDLRNKDLWQKTKQQVQKIAEEEHIKIIEVESNLRRIMEPILAWDNTFIGGLAAVALVLRKNLKKAYRSSAYKDDTHGGFLNTDIDEYLCTEKFSLLLDGKEVSRLEKVKKIAKSQIVLDYLRVCYLNKKNAYNCGKCEKCLRTMIGLITMRRLSKAKTFPDKIDKAYLQALTVPSQYNAIYHKENLDELKKQKIEPELQKALELKLQNIPEKRFSLPNEILNYIIYIDHMYNKGRAFNAISDSKRKF